MPLSKQHRGFTLIELLAVIAVLGVLAAAVAAAIPRVLVGAQSTHCASNLRQIGLAMRTYAAEHDGWLPETRHTAGTNAAWIQSLAPYLDHLDEVRICPADPKGRQRLAAGGTSYILNSEVFVPKRNPWGQPIGDAMNNVQRLPSPARTLLAFTISDNRGAGDSNDHTHSDLWSSWGAFLGDVEPDRFRVGSRQAGRTAGRANYLFADGRVQAIEAAEIKRAFDRGVNIALPGEASL